MAWFSLGGAPKKREKPLILHIDDAQTILIMTQGILETFGLDTIQATDAGTGMQLAEKEVPDLILLDAMMPEIDGFQACQMLRANEKTKAIPILMVTGIDQMSEIERALQAGANGFVPKPINEERLRAKIGEWIKLPTAKGEVPPAA